eukprot:gnl/MRDRNA2_/MRDRNA2_96638_c0_seq1.p1 gnl/MRDRNA2_/MRDRNA2_96638_c0~~gnl/MRDRNA2_/MRDRNA2_96638_c0_seq1.p1  ORF type:complete len:424 (+),score=71.82 gnl/MRDRNA2_/MRDRNA2_96638_c0_seq1:58-1329(+)
MAEATTPRGAPGTAPRAAPQTSPAQDAGVRQMKEVALKTRESLARLEQREAEALRKRGTIRIRPKVEKKTAPTPSLGLAGTPRDWIDSPGPCLYDLASQFQEIYKRKPDAGFTKTPRVLHDESPHKVTPGPAYYSTAEYGSFSARSASSRTAAKVNTFGKAQRVFGASLETDGPGPVVDASHQHSSKTGLGKDGTRVAFPTTPRLMYVPPEGPGPNIYSISYEEKIGVSRNKGFGLASRSDIVGREADNGPGPGIYDVGDSKSKKPRSKSTPALKGSFSLAPRMLTMKELQAGVLKSPGPGAYDQGTTLAAAPRNIKSKGKNTGFGTSERTCLSASTDADARDYQTPRESFQSKKQIKKTTTAAHLNTGFGKSPRVIGERQRDGPGPGAFSPPWSAPAKLGRKKAGGYWQNDSPSYTMAGKPP